MEEFGRHRVEIDSELSARLSHVRQRQRLLGLRRREWAFLSLFLLFALAAHANFQRVVVSGHSMDPTFHSGESLIIWKLAPHDQLRPGNVIVFRQGAEELIKRIVYITPPQEKGLFPPPHFPRALERKDPSTPTFLWYFFQVRIGLIPRPPISNTIYVMGDNYPISDDSRHFGPINPSQVLGRVIY